MKVEALTAERIFEVYEKVGMEISAEHAVNLEEGHGYTLVDEGGAFAVGGIYPLRPGVGMAWTLMTRRWRKYAKVVTAFCLSELDKSPLVRLEAATLAGWAPGAGWLERMGFAVETPRARLWDGVRDYALFVRLKQ